MLGLTGISSWASRVRAAPPDMSCLAARRVRITDKAARTLIDDSSIGRACQNAGADFRADVPQGQLEKGADCRRYAAHPLGDLRDGPRIHGALVLGAAVPLPDAVLLPLCKRRVRAGIFLPGHVDSRGTADHPVR